MVFKAEKMIDYLVRILISFLIALGAVFFLSVLILTGTYIFEGYDIMLTFLKSSTFHIFFIVIGVLSFTIISYAFLVMDDEDNL